MDGFERSTGDELDWEGADGEASDVADAPASAEWSDEEKALVVRECCWPGTRWAKSPGATGCRPIR